MPGLSKESVILEKGKAIPQDILCGICGNILLHPVLNTCPHIFCFGCVRRKLSSTQAARKCPTCDAEWESEPREAPDELKSTLNNLKFHCPHKCGAELHLNEKETHFKKYCPNTILDCPNLSKGCRSKTERKHVADHLDHCHYREVTCEACGHRCLYVNLFAHQVLKRCVRDSLKKQYVQSLKKNHDMLVNYSRSMKQDRIKISQENHNAEIRYKGLNPLRYRRLYSNYGTPSPRHASIYDELMSRPATSMSSSRNADYARNCRRCNVNFKPTKNHDKACRYHREPFLDLFEASSMDNFILIRVRRLVFL